MTQNTIFTQPGKRIHTLGPVEDLSFFDTQSLILPQKISPVSAWTIMTSRPMPLLNLAFRIRDAVSARFGVRRIGGFSSIPPQTLEQGDRLDFFLVEHSSATRLTLTANDRHLDVMTCISTEDTALTISTSVKTHNAFGRCYMIPVAPTHRLIVRTLLKRLRREVSQKS